MQGIAPRTEKETEKETEKASFDDLISRFNGHRDLLEETLAAIASTRKTGKVAESVRVGIIKDLARYPLEVAIDGCQTYLARDCAGEGKAERYLLGIIRGKASEPTKQPRTKQGKPVNRPPGR